MVRGAATIEGCKPQANTHGGTGGSTTNPEVPRKRMPLTVREVAAGDAPRIANEECVSRLYAGFASWRPESPFLGQRTPFTRARIAAGPPPTPQKPRHPGRRIVARVLDACQTACETGDLEVAERLLNLAERLLEDRPEPAVAPAAPRRRGRPPRHGLAVWQEDAEAFVALCSMVWRLRRARQRDAQSDA